MSSDEPQSTPWWKNWKLVGLGLALVVTVVVFPLLIVGSSQTRTTGPSRDTKDNQESPLEVARLALQRQTDLTTCRSALQQINTYLGAGPGRPRAALPAAQARQLQDLFGLDAGEVEEITGSNYTALDGHYLDLCFLLRDAARSLDVKGLPNGPDGKPLRPSPLDRATAAFAWVVRQVRLAQSGEQVPPAFALRRGWGSAAERAMIFLNLLEQLSPPEPGGGPAEMLGCLVLCPDKEGKSRLWACGVVVGAGREVYLFDPRLGLPLPGPKGQGVATLADAGKDPALLAQLNVDAKHPYDVTAEQAKKAQLQLYRPLSALAPRMKPLQEQLLGPALQVRLAADAEKDLARLRAAAKAQGLKEDDIKGWPEGARLLRIFLPPEEGGVDQAQPFPLRLLSGFTTADDPAVVRMQRRQLFTLTLVPWAAYPRQFRDPAQFRFDVGLGERLHTQFAAPFVRATLEPGQPRDLLLRGRFTEAARKLVEEQEEVWPVAQRRRADTPDLERHVGDWVQKALGAYAAQIRERERRDPAGLAAADQQVAEVWKDSGPILIFLQGAMAGPRGAEVVYQLGLCKHEQAERQQARRDLLARGGGAAGGQAEAARAQEAWQDALRWWNAYAEEYPRSPALAAVSRLRGRAQEGLGDRAAAAATWSAPPEGADALEHVAYLYLARQAKPK
jgi:hypothetical protein